MKRMAMMALLAGFTAAVLAAPAVDGRGRVTCTTEELHDCVAGAACLGGLPAEYGAPTALRIDFSARQVLGERRKSKIRDFEQKDGQLLLQGRELGYAWTIGIDGSSGDMTMSLVSREGAFVIFGRCASGS